MNSHRALIVDDEQDICFLLGKILKDQNYDVTLASNLKDCMLQLKKVNPEILFLDIHLPDGSGLDAVKEIRKQNPDLKIIVMSAYDGLTERNRAVTEGADVFIGKPLNAEKIRNTFATIHSKH